MSWEEFHRNEERQRRDHERQQREKGLRDQQQRQHEEFMKQQNDHFDRLGHRNTQRDPQPRGGAPFVVWFFGGIGALFGGLNWGWFFGGVLGFLIGGFLGGYLSQRRWGRVLLWIVGLGFVGLIALGIYRAQ
jgi:hypothetical protein